MEAEKYPNPQLPALPIHYQLGDWVREYSQITGKESPAMYIVAMFKDVLYLEIDRATPLRLILKMCDQSR